MRGEECLRCYLDSLFDLEKKNIQSCASKTEVRSGDGKSVVSENDVQ